MLTTQALGAVSYLQLCSQPQYGTSLAVAFLNKGAHYLPGALLGSGQGLAWETQSQGPDPQAWASSESGPT